MSVAVGAKAPQFTLVDTTKTPRSTLSESSGKKIVLLFYPGAFTGVCDKEMCNFRDSMSAYNGLNAQVIGISVDGPWANKAFADHYKLNFPLLSDFDRTVIKQYGIVFEGLGGVKGYIVAKRAVFVIDEKGIVKYGWVSDTPGVEPPYDEVKKAVA
jgi:glutaredoxin-dependent peroxiredoxin